jgi:hypothetical protein
MSPTEAHEAGRRVHVDARDAHQPQHFRPRPNACLTISPSRAATSAFKQSTAAQAAIEREALVGKQLQRCQSAPSFLREAP